MDFGSLLKLKSLMSTFKETHPGVVAFLTDAPDFASEGSVLEMCVTTPDGEKKVTNMRIKESDLELLRVVQDVIRKNK